MIKIEVPVLNMEVHHVPHPEPGHKTIISTPLWNQRFKTLYTTLQEYELRDYVFKVWKWHFLKFGVYEAVDTTYDAQGVGLGNALFGLNAELTPKVQFFQRKVLSFWETLDFMGGFHDTVFTIFEVLLGAYALSGFKLSILQRAYKKRVDDKSTLNRD